MKLTKENWLYVATGVLLFAIAAHLFFLQTDKAIGSVAVSNEYTATSTAANSVYGATITGDKLVRTGSGSLGQVVITGANTGVLNIYDATTTSVLLRTGQVATSTILIASFPASAAAGTYTFDAVFNTGLLLDLESGNMATTTILYR